MKPKRPFFAVLALCLVPCAFGGGAVYAAQAPVNAPTPVIMGGGNNNLTQFTGNAGAMNNNNWNAQMNPSAGVGAKADFGNCNALISRCATPKCSGGGCMDMGVASAIVSGCVQSNPNCRQYGNELVNYMAAQLVANSSAAVNQQQAQIAAQQAAAEASAGAAAAEQMAEMQMQMQQQMAEMQQQMAQQAEESAQRMEAAMEAQREAAAAAAAAAATPPPSSVDSGSGYSEASTNVATQIAAAHGIPADVLVREQVSGQILTKLENSKVALKSVKSAMQDAFEYAGCTPNGTDCRGPRRVAAFKQKTQPFFDNYNTVLDEVYDALITAQAVGVDITDIIMMLENSCNVWGKYMCPPGVGTLWLFTDESGMNECLPTGHNRCVKKMNPNCQLLQTFNNNEEVQQNWLYPEQAGGNKPCTQEELKNGHCVITDYVNTVDPLTGQVISTPRSGYKLGAPTGPQILVGCASDALNNSPFFKNRKKQSNIGIEDLEQVIAEDYVPVRYRENMLRDNATCNVGSAVGGIPPFKDIRGWGADPVLELQKLVASRNAVAPRGITLGGGDNYQGQALVTSNGQVSISVPIEYLEQGCEKGSYYNKKTNKCDMCPTWIVFDMPPECAQTAQTGSSSTNAATTETKTAATGNKNNTVTAKTTVTQNNKTQSNAGTKPINLGGKQQDFGIVGKYSSQLSGYGSNINIPQYASKTNKVE